MTLSAADITFANSLDPDQDQNPQHRENAQVSMRLYCVTRGANVAKARIFLLVDLREIFFRFRVGGTKKNIKKKL